jgi:kynureninase
MGPTFERAPGIAGWLVGTPPILALAGVAAGIEVVADAGIDAIRAKSVALTAYAVALVDELLAALGCTTGSPRDPARRGGHVGVRHPRARELVGTLLERGVITDFREPDVVRLGLAPLTTSFADVRTGAEALREILESG